MKKRYLALSAVATTALVVPMTAGVANANQSAPRPTVVVAGLNNPRQLALTNSGQLLIAEAGKGGTLAQLGSPEEGVQGLGYSGSVSMVQRPAWTMNSTPHRILTGLLSAASPDGSGAVGTDGVSGYATNTFAVQQTAFPPDVVSSLPGNANRFNGGLLRANGDTNRAHLIANMAAYEATVNPDGQEINPDPYAVLQVGDYNLVADAGGNDILKVDRWGHISTFHVFKNIVNATCLDPSLQQPPPSLPGCQFVPTSMDTDIQGNVYVGGLGGLVPGQAQVVKLTADGKRVLKVWKGFTAVSGVAINDHGDLFVSQLFAPEANPVNPAIQGVLTRISHTGQVTNVDVPFPAGIITDASPNVYVAAFSIAPENGLADPSTGQLVPGTSGQVWRFRW